MINFICVYKEGNGFTRDYVTALMSAVKRNTDKYRDEILCHCCASGTKEGWWNKIDMFSITGACVYIDLDTVVLDSLDPLFELALNCKPDEFYMLAPFNLKRRYGKWASGIMVWNGDFSFILKEYNSDKCVEKNDQRYIAGKLRDYKINSIQDMITGVYSYKRHCSSSPLPDNARIVCFHGKPRPADVLYLSWVKQNWRYND